MTIKSKEEYLRQLGWLEEFHTRLEEIRQRETGDALPEGMKKALIRDYQLKIAAIDDEINAYAEECKERAKMAKEDTWGETV